MYCSASAGAHFPEAISASIRLRALEMISWALSDKEVSGAKIKFSTPAVYNPSPLVLVVAAVRKKRDEKAGVPTIALCASWPPQGHGGCQKFQRERRPSALRIRSHEFKLSPTY